jgi:17 kDa common-antigen outer membrane protein
MRTNQTRLLALAIFATCAPALTFGGNLSFLKNSPVTYFKKQDMDMLTRTAEKVLESQEANASGSWSNPKTGNSGEITLAGQFTSTEGLTCKRLRVLNRAKVVEGTALHTVCKTPDRGWVLHADARPAPAG